MPRVAALRGGLWGYKNRKPIGAEENRSNRSRTDESGGGRVRVSVPQTTSPRAGEWRDSAQPSADLPWPNNKHKRLHLHLSYGLSVLALLAFGAWYGLFSWQATQRVTLMRFSLLSEVIANTADATFEHYHVALRLLGHELAHARGWKHPERARARLQRFQRAYPDVASVNLIRPDGQIVASNVVPPGHRLPDFHLNLDLWPGLHRAETRRGLIVARPVYGPLIHHWVIPLRYTVRAPSGVPRFVLTAPLRLREEEAQWRRLPLARAPLQGLMIGLTRDDGYLEELWPVPRQSDFKALYGRPAGRMLVRVLRAHLSAHQGHFRGTLGNSLGPVPLLGAYRRLAHYPMTVFIAAPVHSIVGLWWRRTRLLFALIGLMLGASGGFYLWILSRERAADARQAQAMARLAYQAHYDALTGLLNRRGLQEMLEREHARAEHRHQPYSLLLVDLDYLKLINDGYGHEMGDRVLVQIAGALSETLREGDSAGRWGGDEFLCLLQDTDAPAAHPVAEHLQERCQRRC